MNISPEQLQALAERIAANVEPIPLSGCWIWTGTLNQKGYGNISIKNRRHLAHRISYQLTRGPIPDRLVIDHLCRVRCCVNPEHLEPVTNQVNILRGTGSPALLRQRTHCNFGHEFTDENTLLRQGYRRCAICYKRDAAKHNLLRAARRAKRRSFIQLPHMSNADSKSMTGEG